MDTTQRMFISGAEVNKRFQASGRRRNSKLSTLPLAHLVLPSGGAMYALSVVEALLISTNGPIDRSEVARFRDSPVGRQALITAKLEFLQQVRLRAAAEPCPGLLTIDDVAWLTGVTRSAVTNWRDKETLPVDVCGELFTVKPQNLLDRCGWASGH